MEQVRNRYDGEVSFVCGYEAGCLGYSLYHQLKEHAVDCKILAPTTMAITNTNRVKTDRKDAANIARCLAFHTYSEVYERLRRRFYKLTLSKGINRNKATAAIARELSCFIWGMMTGNVA